MLMTDKGRELVEEFRTVVIGRGNLFDVIVPPVVFVIINELLGLEVAVWGSIALAALIIVVRLARRQSLRNAFGGLGGVFFAILVAMLLGRAEGYFLPAIITGGLTVIVCLVSVLARRPLVAWTSHVARRWPLDWYWHPKVRPAYSEVTLAWAVFFALRLVLQLALFEGEAPVLLAVFNVLAGWPATVTLLVMSYLYGAWRLRHLRGPSVQEFKGSAKPPWSGQRRGF
jgi:hypothetical protein